MGSNGICVVFENPCTESFTHQINGPHAKYFGVGNLHDERYDEFVLHHMLHSSADQQQHSGVAHNDEHCPISTALYPSNVMKASYVTHRPIILAVAVLFIFGFTSVVFYLYHKMVERGETRKYRSRRLNHQLLFHLCFLQPYVIASIPWMTKDQDD
jgi:hypothetical protein